MHDLHDLDDLFEWIRAFLSGHTQQVKIKNTLSHSIFVTSGVPQGSCLGPTLFLLYINDLVHCFDSVQCNIKLDADDAKLIVHIDPMIARCL